MSQGVMIIVIFDSPDRDNFAYIFISGFKIYIYIFADIYPTCTTSMCD